MQQQSGSSASHDPELIALVKRKAALSRVLTVVMFIAYFGFMGLLAFEQRPSVDGGNAGTPGVLSTRIGAATLGIPLGIGLIIFTWALTGIYVRWANGAYDAVVARLKSK